MPTRITTYCPASSIFPDATAEYTANGSVLVFPLIFPAIIAVAPNSPSPLANARTAPEITLAMQSASALSRKCSTRSFQVFFLQKARQDLPAQRLLLLIGTLMEMRSQPQLIRLLPMRMRFLLQNIQLKTYRSAFSSRKYKVKKILPLLAEARAAG